MRKKLAGIIILAIIVLASGSGYCEKPAAGRDAGTDYLKIGFDLMRNEAIGFLKIGMTDSEVLTGLGEPDDKSPVRVWGADGLEHQQWHYPTAGVELDMVRRSGTQTVNMIRIKSPCAYLTKQGLGIGSTAQEVQAAYKNELNPEFSDRRLVAGSAYGGIIFGLSDSVVSSISSALPRNEVVENGYNLIQAIK